MKSVIIALILGLVCNSAAGHELTPTYPEFRPAFMNNISVTTMELYNAREEIEFYAIEVYDENWDPVPFLTRDRIVRVQHLERLTFEVYIRDEDLNNIEYICTTSRLIQDEIQSQGLSSRICSRIR